MGATAKYIGSQDAGDGFLFRLYNIEGDHRLRGSTVDVETLIAEGIDIPDLNAEQIEAERKIIKAFLGFSEGGSC